MTNETAEPRSASHLAALAAGLVALLACGWLLSSVPLKFDDFDYLSIALTSQDRPAAVLERIWFAHWRPLNAAVWWSLGPLSLDGHWVRISLVLGWALTGWLALRRSAALGWTSVAALMAALLLSRAWLDVLGWRSWLTTAGTCLFLVAALAEVDGRRRSWVIGLFVILGLGFKETGALLTGILVLLLPGKPRWVGFLAVGAALVIASFASGRAAIGHVPGNIPMVLEALSLCGWLLPVAMAVRSMRWWVVCAAAVVVALLGSWSGPLVPIALLALVQRPRQDLPWVLGIATAWLLPLFGHAFSQVYLAEGCVLLALWLAWRIRPPVWSWLVALPLLLVPLVDLVGDRWRSAEVLADQQHFLQTWQPPRAESLYAPPGTKPDVDTLLLISRGGRIKGLPPENGRPVEIGPRSGIWIEAEPSRPGEPLRFPRRGPRRGRR